MARAVWEGEISFGLINIQVELFSAVKRSQIHFHLLDKRDGSRVKYVRVNEETGEEVPWNEIAEGYEYSEGNYVMLDKEELKEARPELTKSIDLEEFVDLSEISVLLYDKPYYLVPTEKGEKAYVLLREALRQKNKAGIGRVVIRTKEYIAALFPVENALVLNLLFFPQEIKSLSDCNFPDLSSFESKIKDRELELSSRLIDNMTRTWNPEDYSDRYNEALEQWIEEKIHKPSKKKTAKKKKEPEETEPINIEALLDRSLRRKESHELH